MKAFKINDRWEVDMWSRVLTFTIKSIQKNKVVVAVDGALKGMDIFVELKKEIEMNVKGDKIQYHGVDIFTTEGKVIAPNIVILEMTGSF